jgi:hypothetical protein
MISPTPAARMQPGWCFACGFVVAVLLGVPQASLAQGLVKGVQQGAEAGNKAAGPVGGVLGGAIGGVVGVFNGVLGVGGDDRGKAAAANTAAPAGSAKQPQTKAAKSTKVAKATPGKPVEVLTQAGEPELTAEQIVANSDANIDRIRTELKLTPEQEKHWGASICGSRVPSATRRTTLSSRCGTRPSFSTIARWTNAALPMRPTRSL